MALRFNSFYKQVVTEAELDAMLDGLEAADWALGEDWALTGIISGGAVTAETPSSLNIAIGGPFLAYTPEGKRLYVSAVATTKDCSTDVNGASTLPTLNLERYLLLVAAFDRALSNQRTDGNGDPIWYQRDESVTFEIIQGSEAAVGAAVPPTVPSARTVLKIIKLTNVAGVIEISGSDLFDEVSTTRRDDWLYYNYSLHFGVDKQYGTPSEALQFLFGYLDTLTATQVAKANPPDWTGGAAWKIAHGSTADDMLDSLVNNLASQATGGGAHLLGIYDCAAWHDTTANAAGSLFTRVNGIITDLVNAAGSDRIGAAAYAPGGAYSISAGSVQDQLQGLLTSINSHVATGGGDHAASVITYTPGVNWYGGGTTGDIAATDVQAAISEIVTDLVATASSTNSGTARIGGNQFTANGAIGANSISVLASSLVAQLEAICTYMVDCVYRGSVVGDAQTVNCDYLPGTSALWDLGTTLLGWKDLWLTGEIQLANSAVKTKYRVFPPMSSMWMNLGENNNATASDDTHWQFTVVGGSPAVNAIDPVTSLLYIPLSPALLAGETLKQVEVDYDNDGAGNVTMNVVRQSAWNSNGAVTIGTLTFATDDGRHTYTVNVNPDVAIDDDDMLWLQIQTDTTNASYFGCRAQIEFNSLIR